MRRKILVVDDTPIVRIGTAMSLTDMGFEVDQAQSGSEALDLVKDTRYAIILMDYHMPEWTAQNVLGSSEAMKVRLALGLR